ncbi:MAG TPA: peptidylprolyl isomerase [Phycisphaerales bacterium]|nr:peptidylprolyl isomerase [Phycisphaerales bacterium]
MRMPLCLLVLACLASALGCANHGPAAAASGPSPITVLMRTTRGDITLELDPGRAPITVANFLAHAQAGHYDGTIFHRVIPTFVIQGGGFTPDLRDRSRLAVAAGRPDTPIANEWTNGLKNVRGTIAMARDAAPDTATREFYINVADNPRLDTAREKTGNAGYAVFGRVVNGMGVVDEIRNGATYSRPDVIVDGEGMQNVPIDPVVVLGVTRIEPARR